MNFMRNKFKLFCGLYFIFKFSQWQKLIDNKLFPGFLFWAYFQKLRQIIVAIIPIYFDSVKTDWIIILADASLFQVFPQISWKEQRFLQMSLSVWSVSNLPVNTFLVPSGHFRHSVFCPSQQTSSLQFIYL